MIHEALFYLWNCPGDLFKTNKKDDWINSVSIQDFLHPAERELLQRIMTIALNYHEIEDFRKTVENQHIFAYDNHITDDNVSNEIKPGLYVKAFCNGVDTVLESYRNEIVNLEDVILKNPQLSLTFVLSSVEKYVTLFKTLKQMIQLIKSEKIHGCPLIGKLQSYIDSGIDAITEPTLKIILSVNTVFYKHLCNWIVYGDLIDNCNEFFICDANCADENFLYPDQLKESDGLKKDSYFDIDFSKKHKVKRPCEVRKFYLKKDMVPINISMETAETILFLGQIVWIIRNDPKTYFDDKFQLKFKRDMWDGTDVEYYRKLQSLENVPFNSNVFDKTIEECRLKLTKYLWKIMIDEAKLLDHLQLIRDYYALGRGELFQQFIVLAEDHIKDITNEHILTNLNFIFSETARKLYTENDKSYLSFELTLPKPLVKSNNSSPWSRLEINFNVSWPLHILFHPTAMGFYNKLFCFLLKVKKTHIDLHKIWLFHMEGKHKIDPAVWTLRNNLMYIVNNLQYYLQVDVIEARFAILKSAIQDANEFEDIIRLHSEFLKNLLHETFVMTAYKDSELKCKHTLYQVPALKQEKNSMVYETILQILSVCDKFCSLVKNWQSDLTEVDLQKLSKLKTESESLIEMLLHVLYSLHQKSSGQHLLQLLHHIDYNRWFSKNIVNLNLTVS
ncbi:hypothetical protein PPYR_00162 [Photinus pyralis]|uniref:Gamma-tubulin complex component n=2 Tax=Photinus pyralis TaxID=7054 RepID=A0A5N4B0S4_PHOPY|nr:gamma-tubulin complex component 4-like [Photinus pyralis]XP_031337173.1 gamma-tubulin complex component 4-like [Photinus pyralis]KAB0803192.1 hypothetical protein PPYR_00162 [Photinus pyralis]